MKFDARKEQQEIEDWLKWPAGRLVLFEEPLGEIQNVLLREPSIDGVGALGSHLCVVSSRYAHMALQSAFASLTDSFAVWLTYFDFIRHSMRMRVLRIEHPEGNGSIGAYEIQRHFTLLLGIGLVNEAVWLGQRIYDSIQRRMKHPVVWTLHEISEADIDRPITSDDDPRILNSESISGYTESPLCGFVLRMWLVLAGRREPMDRLPDKAPQCGVDDALFDGWNSPEKLKSAISDACDFHVRRMKEDRRIHHDIAEFEHSPFRQIPFEILAYRKLRRHLGLETPFPAHPLLDSPFVKSLPEKVTPSGDPLLAQVLEYSRKVLPDL